MEGIHIHSEEFLTPLVKGTGLGTLTKEEAVGYLIKVGSHKLLPVKIEEGGSDRFKESVLRIARQGLPKDVEQLVNLDYRMRNPETVGRLAHLSSHLKHTGFREIIADQSDPLKSVWWWLEDLRSEMLYLTERQLDTLNIRSYRLSRLKELEAIKSPSILDTSLVYLASVARVSSGVFLREEAKKMRETFARELGEETLDEMERIIDSYLSLDGSPESSETAKDLAERWVQATGSKMSELLSLACMDSSDIEEIDAPELLPNEIIDPDPSEEDDFDEEGAVSEFDEGDSGEDGGDDRFSSEETLSEETSYDDSPLEGVSDEVEENEPEQKTEETFHPEAFDEGKYQKKQEEEKVREFVRRVSEKTFPKEALQYNSRPATSSDQALASSLVVTFRKARWRAPSKTFKTSKTPPGKLVSRSAVTMAAQRSMGVPVTAEPFKQVIRKRVEGPPPIVGMACDISGSMRASEEPMAQIMWACSRAIPRVGGTFSAVSFGRKVKALVPPGAKIAQVPIIRARDDYEEAFGAISALSGGLGFLNKSDGVKILIISSDAQWRTDQIGKSLDLLHRLEKSGVHVFWIPFQSDVFMKDIRQQTKSVRYLVPFLEVGSVIEFDKTGDIPTQLGKLIAKRVEQE